MCYAIFLWESPLMTSDIRVGRGAKIAPKIRHYKVGQGRQDGQKWPKFLGRH